MTQRLTSRPNPSRSKTLLPTPLWALGLAVLGLFLLATPAQAQDEEPKPTRYEDVNWNQVVLVDFKSGKKERAMEIIDEYFDPIAKKAGNQMPRAVELQTGPWDLLLVWTMEEGPSAMTWKTSPENVEAMKAAREMFGKEKMEKIGDEYTSLINRTTSFLGFSGRHGAPITAGMPK